MSADPRAVRAMFARIAPRYDLLNRLLSARCDVRWRRRAVAMLPPGGGLALDLACGTGDLGLAALALRRAAAIVGCDACLPMLQAGRRRWRGLPFRPLVGDALRLPFPDRGFDAAMLAYGWRNFCDPRAALAELRRVLRPGGHLLILEFFRPQRPWPRLFYRGVARRLFPLVGGWVAGDAAAYRYLACSVDGFLSVAEADALLASCGFRTRRWRAFAGGISHAVAAVADGVREPAPP
ncbi:MAG: ubiquinone/menaquinone biosynthesis methyltransferase [Planctomycetota bacterium]|nr:ubiquinone/menaquinone biosynthesis methyltransferase [Planctomycetota bacterium]MCX8039233.1 ubiquinone/menaquinone biosynthesis methyltransferase [Planctomycetota bacterium]MDW8372658.1 ubiquinone/menaquinone biosynthesis methyltransferase [Planctomycetota bacterium]